MDYYSEILASQDEYVTKYQLKRKPLLGTTFKFYKNVALVINYSYHWARKGIYNDFRWVYSSLGILHSTEKAGLKYHIEGMNNLSKIDGPTVFIANHMSTLETLVIPCIINPIKKIVFVIKRELINYPVFGKVVEARDPIVVGRSNPRDDLRIVLEEGSARLKRGISIVIFPQRTRSAKFNSSSFNSLGVKLAKRNNVPVIPIALVTDAWANGKHIKELGKIDISKQIHFKIGEPITIKSNGNEEHQYIIEFITKNLREWGREDLINL